MTNPVRSTAKIRFRPLLGLLLLAGLIPLFTGCVVMVAGAAGAGAVAYVRGELEVNLEHNLDAVYRASQQALEQLEFIRIDNRRSGVDAQLVSRTALDKRVEIKLKKISGRVTQVQIRVGLVGDQELSLMILEKIKAGL